MRKKRTRLVITPARDLARKRKFRRSAKKIIRKYAGLLRRLSQ